MDRNRTQALADRLFESEVWTLELYTIYLGLRLGLYRALSAGGRSDGAPGIRPHDRVKYYAAFVLDPDGNRIEAVTFPRE